MLGPREKRNQFIDQLDFDRVMSDCRWIAEETPWRLSGSENGEKAAAYIVEELRKSGVKAELQSFYGYLNFPEPAFLEVRSPETRQIPCAAFAQIGSTPEAGLEEEVIYVGSGGEDRYEGLDVRGKIVLCELSYAPPRPEKVRIAVTKGAAGVIMMNWGSDDNPIIPLGTVKPVWGNPTPENVHLMPDIPVLGIPRRDGVYLRSKLQSGQKVTVWMKAHSIRKWMKASEATAEVEAPRGDGDFLLVAGHMDSWAQGATDNASGNAVKMELARALLRNRDQLARTVKFAFWQAHETGIMEGSTWYLDKHWDELDEHCVAYFNYDSPGMKGASVWRTDSSAELLAFHRAVEDEVIPGMPRKRNKVERTGDQSFFGIGIPAICAWAVHTDEEIARWNGAILGEWYHSEADTMEILDPVNYRRDMTVYGGYTWEMATAKVLPVEFRTVADDFTRRIAEVNDKLSARPDAADAMELQPVMAYAEAFKARAAALEERRSRVESERTDPRKLNETFKQLSRTLTWVRGTVSGRYDQDTYGLSALHHNIPNFQVVERLLTTEPGSHEFHLWATKARRERNKVSDTLRRGAATIDSFLA